MPEFTPTEWMLEHHRDKGEHDWEIFAECVREAMARHSGFELCNRSNREKLDYEYFMCKKTEEVTVDGRMFKYEKGQGYEDISKDDDF